MQELLVRKQTLDWPLSVTYFVTLGKIFNFCVACLLYVKKPPCLHILITRFHSHTMCECNSLLRHPCSALTLRDTLCTLLQLHAQEDLYILMKVQEHLIFLFFFLFCLFFLNIYIKLKIGSLQIDIKDKLWLRTIMSFSIFFIFFLFVPSLFSETVYQTIPVTLQVVIAL